MACFDFYIEMIWIVSIMCFTILITFVRTASNTYRLKPRIWLTEYRYDLEQKYYVLFIFPYWKDTLKSYNVDEIEQAKRDIEHLMSNTIIIN